MRANQEQLFELQFSRELTKSATGAPVIALEYVGNGVLEQVG